LGEKVGRAIVAFGSAGSEDEAVWRDSKSPCEVATAPCKISLGPDPVLVDRVCVVGMVEQERDPILFPPRVRSTTGCVVKVQLIPRKCQC